MRDISWSLRPTLSWLGVLGVDLQLPADAGGGSTLRGRSRRVWAGILFGFFAGSRLYLLVTDELRVVQDEGEAPVEQYSLTATWTRHLRHTTAALAPILVFASFLAAVALRWRQLSHCLAATLHQMDLNDQFYRRLRRISVAGLLCILMEILVEIYEHFTDPNTKKMNRFARRALNWASDVYRFSPVVLFGCLVSTASMTLDAIIADVDRHQRSRRVEARLLHWRHQLGHIHDLIGAVNAFFGKAMLFFFVQLFISFVVYLFRIISEVRKDPTSPSNGVAVLRILKDVFWFIIVTAVSEQIPQRVETLINRLSNLRYRQQGNSSQVDHFIVELTLNQPKISVMGFFNVGINLYAPLIGTTVTYLVIFLQFQSSETS